MAQRNPSLEAERSSSTGRMDETTTHSNTHSAGHGVKGLLAGIHGLGEKVRGEFNGAVDVVAGDEEGLAKDHAVADAGDRERLTGTFEGRRKIERVQ
ncbi:hypothetical protein PZA11_007334 [Diplocarpon coronariae]